MNTIQKLRRIATAALLALSLSAIAATPAHALDATPTPPTAVPTATTPEVVVAAVPANSTPPEVVVAAVPANSTPTAVAVTAVTSTSNRLTWAAPTNATGLTGYTVQWSSGGSTFASGVSSMDVGAATLTATATGMDPARTYYMRVKANLTGLTTAYSAPVLVANKMTLKYNIASKKEVILPLFDASTNVFINWGDGQTQTVTNPTTLPRHTYASGTATTVTIAGYMPAWATPPAGSSLAVSAVGTANQTLTAVTVWGANMGTTRATYAFYGAAALTSVVQPPLAVTDYSSLFSGASNFNQNISSWSTGNVTNMQAMFVGAAKFDQPIGTWNTAKVTNLTSTFQGATVFNQPLATWSTAAVTTMVATFADAKTFNQPLGTWNTGNVTTMDTMFMNAYKFNQPIGTWNTAKVTNMRYMFCGSYAFNQAIGTWNTAKVTDMRNMFYAAATFNRNISTWNVAAVTTWTSFHASSALTQANTPAKLW